MPELPDFQVFSRNLSEKLLGKTVEKLHAINKKNLKPRKKGIKGIKGIKGMGNVGVGLTLILVNLLRHRHARRDMMPKNYQPGAEVISVPLRIFLLKSIREVEVTSTTVSHG